MASPLDRFGAPSPSTDIALGWIAKLLPDGGNALVVVLSYLSSAMAWFAAGSLMYFTFAAMMATAHDGKMLGERWHTFNAPIRVMLGVALLLPVAGGLGAGQLAVIELGKAGSGLASSMWARFVEEVTEKGGMVPTPRTLTGGRVVRWAYESEVCHAIAGQTVLPGNPGYRPGMDPLPDPPPAAGKESAGATGWDYGAACGALSLPGGTTADEKTFATARAAAVANVVAEIRASGTPAAVAKAAVMAEGQGGGDWPTGVTAWLDQLASRYDSQVTAAAGAFVTSRDRENRGKLAAASKAEGWVTAGKFSRVLNDLSAVSARESERLPDRRPVDLSAFDSTTHGTTIADGMRDSYGAAIRQLEAEAKAAAAPSVTADDLTQAGDSDSFFARLMAPLTRPIAEWALSVDDSKDPNIDPIGALMSLGHVAVGASQAAIAAGVVVAAASGNIIAGAAGGEAAFVWAASFAKLAIYGALGAGLLLAYVLPMMPFIWIFWHAAAWVVALVEALIAMPIALLMWIRMDGAELVDGPQKAMVSLLFALFLRPVIGILSLCATYYTLPHVVGTMRREFGVSFLGNQGGHVVGVFGLIVGLLLLAYLTFKLTVTLLEMVSKSGDRIARWFGAPPDHMGEGGGTAVIGTISQSTRSLGHAAPGPKRPGGDGDGDGESGGVERGGPGPRVGIRRGAP
ncbi:MAG: DotA/TraY family protein [Pigmentiphaga sp.]